MFLLVLRCGFIFWRVVDVGSDVFFFFFVGFEAKKRSQKWLVRSKNKDMHTH